MDQVFLCLLSDLLQNIWMCMSWQGRHFEFSIYIRIKLYRRLYKGYCISGYFMRVLFSLTRTANSWKQKPTDVLFFPVNVEKNVNKHSMMIFWFQCYGFSFWFVINVVAIFIFNVLRLEVIVLFVYIDGIVDHHWLNFFSKCQDDQFNFFLILH